MGIKIITIIAIISPKCFESGRMVGLQSGRKQAHSGYLLVSDTLIS